MAEIGFHDVSKCYPGGVLAVDRLDLIVRDRELVVLVGPSGCGKSTTLRMVAGLEQITSGTIRIGDRVVNGVSPRDRDIAMVFQNHALYPSMTVYKNMAFGLKLRRVPRREIERRVGAAARMLGIEDLLDRRPSALSGGQRQRVAVGRAVVRDPACFLFDEPLSNLDAQLRVQTRVELKRLHRRLRTTTIYVTHDQEEALALGDRVVVMNAARVQQCGPPLTIYDQPVNRFVAGFVGTPPMNFVGGRLVVVDGGPVFQGGGLSIRLDRCLADKVCEHWGREVVCGLRPEAFWLPAEPGRGAGGQQVEMVANVMEPLGSTMDLRCVTPDGTPIVARVRAGPTKTPAKVVLHLDSRQMHFFSPGPNGRALLRPGPQVLPQ